MESPCGREAAAEAAWSAIRSAFRALVGVVRPRRRRAGNQDQPLFARLFAGLPGCGRHLLSRTLGPGRTLQFGTAVGRTRAWPARLQYVGRTALARSGVAGRVLHQDRHRAAGRKPALDTD